MQYDPAMAASSHTNPATLASIGAQLYQHGAAAWNSILDPSKGVGVTSTQAAAPILKNTTAAVAAAAVAAAAAMPVAESHCSEGVASYSHYSADQLSGGGGYGGVYMPYAAGEGEAVAQGGMMQGALEVEAPPSHVPAEVKATGALSSSESLPYQPIQARIPVHLALLRPWILHASLALLFVRPFLPFLLHVVS